MENDACGHKEIRFLVELGEIAWDDMMGYHKLCQIIEDQNNAEKDKDTERAWIFKSIVGHVGPLNHRHIEYEGSKYNVLVQWEDGTETYEALDQVRKDDPVTVAKYAVDNNLLDTDGWKLLRHIAKNQKKLDRMLRQSNLASMRRGPFYMFGIQVPRSDHEANALNTHNRNMKWADLRKAELQQL
jgi:hypothetical protein